jgi:hypothetical protein
VGSCDLQRKLLEDNARMLCMPCCEQDPDTPTEFGFKATTYFKTICSAIAQL